MKKIIWIVLIVIAAAAVYMYAPDRQASETGGTASAEGSVVSVNVEGVALDGPALVTISENGEEKVIAVPSMGINLCAAVDNIADVYTLKAGSQVSVKGELDEEGRIVPCADTSHYLRIEGSVVPPPASSGNSGVRPGGGNNNSSGGGEPVACTMDAMQCPDGSYVGRTGPNCEFVCPGSSF